MLKKFKMALLLLITLTTVATFAQEQELLTVVVTDVQGKKTVVSDLTVDVGFGYRHFKLLWIVKGSASMTVSFPQLAKVQFAANKSTEEPDRLYFRNGNYLDCRVLLQAPDYSGAVALIGLVDFGVPDKAKFRMPIEKVKTLEFDHPGEYALNPAVPVDKYDQITLKNGDVLNGEILDKQFTIITSYAQLTIPIEKVQSIAVEGGGQNIDTIQLRLGDKLSGQWQDPVVQLDLAATGKAEIQRDKIKTILLHERK